ncbi:MULTISPECIES: hypothetical protein [unclassified Streptomyces]|uniref:hypothetical protein n=1 Tax=unclassified Streptomyces TaxID=2593676 RepID=UPI0004BD1727|nr:MULTISPECIES: hypothetical protein [unclassified Streptomyces]
MTDRLEYPTLAITALKRWAPPPALAGFVALLIVMFGVAYAVGAGVGPVAPGMRSTEVESPGFVGDLGRSHGHTGGSGGSGGTR